MSLEAVVRAGAGLHPGAEKVKAAFRVVACKLMSAQAAGGDLVLISVNGHHAVAHNGFGQETAMTPMFAGRVQGFMGDGGCYPGLQAGPFSLDQD